MHSPTGIGSALRSARTARGLSLNQVASQAGISTATLSRIETDKQSVDVELLLVVTGVLRVSPADILSSGDGHDSESGLVDKLAMLSSEQRARVMTAAAKQRPTRSTNASMNARIEALLAAVEIIREELSELQRQTRKRRR